MWFYVKSERSQGRVSYVGCNTIRELNGSCVITIYVLFIVVAFPISTHIARIILFVLLYFELFLKFLLNICIASKEMESKEIYVK